jgi:hypothetical protein
MLPGAGTAGRKAKVPGLTKSRFNHPRFSPAGEERIRRSMARGHRGDDPRLPIRQVSVRRDGRHYISWFGPVDHGWRDQALWEMEVDFGQFRAGKGKKA